MVKIAINGFGRIGRMVFKIALKEPGIEVVGLNDLTDTKTLAYLFKHDSVHGNYLGKVEHDDSNIIVDGTKYPVFAEKDPAALPWGKLGVEIVVESTGRFLTTDLASKHIEAGAKKVLLSAPAKDKEKPIKTIVLGVNDQDIKPEDLILSNASCTTNSIAPLVKVVHEKLGIKSGLLTTIHSYTGDQRLVDAPHKDLRRARHAAINMIPTSTGAAKAVTMVIPSLKGKLDGRAVRVPTPDGSLTDLTAEVEKTTTVEELNAMIKEATAAELNNIVEYSDDDLVSTDIIGHECSAIFDSKLTLVQNGNLIKIFSWYDNEWGYSCRMVQMLHKMAK